MSVPLPTRATAPTGRLDGKHMSLEDSRGCAGLETRNEQPYGYTMPMGCLGVSTQE